MHTKSNRRAITVGQAETGGNITAAAIIMIAVFSGFVLGYNRVVKLVVHRPGERDLHRRVHPAHDPGAGDDATARPAQPVLGVVSFIFADLIILPILVVYAKYYRRRMAWFLAGTFYVTMVAAGYIVELVSSSVHLIPTGPRQANVGETGISWNYTTWLNIVFVSLAVLLIWRFRRTGGRAMLSMMGGGPDDIAAHHDHEQEHAHHGEAHA